MANGNRAADFIDPGVTLDGVPARKLRAMQSLDNQVAIGARYIDSSVRMSGVPARRVRAQSNGGTSVYGPYVDPGVRIDGVPTRRHATGAAAAPQIEFPYPTVVTPDGITVPEHIKILFPCRQPMRALNLDGSPTIDYDSVEYEGLDFGSSLFHYSQFLTAHSGTFRWVCRTYTYGLTIPHSYWLTMHTGCDASPDSDLTNGSESRYYMATNPNAPNLLTEWHQLSIEYRKEVLSPGIERYSIVLHDGCRLPRRWGCLPQDDPYQGAAGHYPNSWITGSSLSALHNNFGNHQSSLWIGDTGLFGLNPFIFYGPARIPMHHVPRTFPGEGYLKLTFDSNEELLQFFMQPYGVRGWLKVNDFDDLGPPDFDCTPDDPKALLNKGCMHYPNFITRRFALGPFDIWILGAANSYPDISPDAFPVRATVTGYLEKDFFFPGFNNVRDCADPLAKDPCDSGYLAPGPNEGACCLFRLVLDPNSPGGVREERQCRGFTTQSECDAIAEDWDSHSWAPRTSCTPWPCGDQPGDQTGACCLQNNAGCVELTSVECLKLAGDFKGVNVHCGDVPAPCAPVP